MRIATTSLYTTAQTQMAALSKKADTLNTQIATTTKIAAASDDPAAWAQLASLKQAKSDGTVWAANVSLAQSLVSQSDSVLGQVQTQLQRAQELATQANTGVLSADQKASITTELKGILSDLAALANTKDARGQPLFAGSSGDAPVSVAADGSVTIAAGGNPPSIPIGDDSSIQPTDSAAKVFGGTNDMFAALSGLITAIDTGGDVAAASTGLNASYTQVTNARASIGARGARLDLESDSLSAAADNNEILRGSLEDTDIATALAELTKTMTILSATQASFTKLSSLSLFNAIS